MIKLSGQLSKKIPISGVDFSSMSYSAGMEKEIDGDVSADAIQAKLSEIYEVLGKAVDEQIRASSATTPGADPADKQGGPVGQDTTARKPARNTRIAPATGAQLRAIYSLAKTRKLPDTALSELVFRIHQLKTPEELNIAQASRVIDILMHEALVS